MDEIKTKHLGEGLWIIPPHHIYNATTKEIKLAYPEELVKNNLDYDFICHNCGYKWKGSYTPQCNQCGHKEKVRKIKRPNKPRKYEFIDRKIIGKIGDYREYAKAIDYMTKKGYYDPITYIEKWIEKWI